jgi:hypothetical protein
LNSIVDESLWRYQRDLIVAARKNDGKAAAAVNDSSLVDATNRIKALLASETVAE